MRADPVHYFVASPIPHLTYRGTFLSAVDQIVVESFFGLPLACKVDRPDPYYHELVILEESPLASLSI